MFLAFFEGFDAHTGNCSQIHGQKQMSRERWTEKKNGRRVWKSFICREDMSWINEFVSIISTAESRLITNYPTLLERKVIVAEYLQLIAFANYRNVCCNKYVLISLMTELVEEGDTIKVMGLVLACFKLLLAFSSKI